jgi:hypothetical protein
MKNLIKQNFIIGLLSLNLLLVANLTFSVKNQTEKINKLSYSKNLSKFDLKVRHDIDMVLFGEPLN